MLDKSNEIIILYLQAYVNMKMHFLKIDKKGKYIHIS